VWACLDSADIDKAYPLSQVQDPFVGYWAQNPKGV